MALFDLPLHELERYTPTLHAPADFDAFWQGTLEDAERTPLNATFTPTASPLITVDVLDVHFHGYGGQRVHGWLLLPRGLPRPLPCVVEYVGYGGGRGDPTDWLLYASAGLAHFVMDTRGQGSVWRRGDTPDDAPSGPTHPGFLTRGLDTRETYYYRRVITDAVRAVQAARTHPDVDGVRVAVAGGSQGGGLALAAAALAPGVTALLADVPFLCHFERAVAVTNSAPYAELRGYLRTHRHAANRVFATLAYFDGMHFAARAHAPALFSVGLMDDVCPPSTVYAAYNRYAGHKAIRVYPYNGHEAGDGPHALERLAFLGTHLHLPDTLSSAP